MMWSDAAMAHLVLGKHAEQEIQRLDEKARLMRADQFDARAAESDRVWRDQNSRMLDTVDRLCAPAGQGSLFA